MDLNCIMRKNIQWSAVHIAIFIGVISASGCATKSESVQKKANKFGSEAGFDSRVGSAITSPLSDLNIVRSDIPEVLINARKAPYLIASDADCAWFEREIDSLNAVLGPDLDVVKVGADGNIVERELGNATINALKSFTEGFVPFRSWVRRLTGADSHAREVAAAGMAGIVRRSYLKGVKSAKPCSAQASTTLESPTTK
jgi:hypothetical protein